MSKGKKKHSKSRVSSVDKKVKAASVQAETKVQEKQPKKLRYCVLFVPNNNHRVRQFSISFDMLLFVTLVGAALLLSIIIYLTSVGMKLQSYEKDIYEKDQIITLLTAENENQQNLLREAKNTIETVTGIQQQETEKANAAGVPDMIPVNVGVKPTEYDKENGVVQFTTGYDTKVLSSADGVVSFVGPDEKYGYVVKIDHGNGYETSYMINCAPTVREKDKVIKGSTLYIVDEDGLDLTYQIKFNGEIMDPMSVIKIDG